MEKIREAVERARAQQHSFSADVINNLAPRRVSASAAPATPLERQIAEIELDSRLLQSKHIICYDGKDQRSRPYDMLRTQVLQSMDANGWRVWA